MSVINSGLNLLFLLLALGILGMSLYALIHALRIPANAFTAAGKLNKNLWLIILAVATLISTAVAWGYLGSFMAVGGMAFIGLSVLFSGGIFSIAAIIAAAVYIVDVKPAVTGTGRGGNNGPYGPW
ncbi:DUF2516 family protein [Nonomuraea sediminis]|uniref:DUF2516 family protein n=1 Tax=Nonomuraea sediminis TaxID=2835864 RepID=UPI001BDCB3BF|nr:DUF2516 family protein [Nonomuraea sediminis]